MSLNSQLIAYLNTEYFDAEDEFTSTLTSKLLLAIQR